MSCYSVIPGALTSGSADGAKAARLFRFVPKLCLTRAHSSAFQRTRADLARAQITSLLRGSGWTPGGCSFTPR